MYSAVNKQLRDEAYNAGVADYGKAKKAITEKAKAEVAERERKIKEAAKAEKKNNESKAAKAENNAPGKGTFESEVDENTLTDKQKAAVSFLRTAAEICGFNVKVTAGTDANGNLSAENGSYNPVTNTITVSVNAGMRSTSDYVHNAILRTVSHELTHMIAASETSYYAELRDYVVNSITAEYGEDGITKRITDISKRYAKEAGRELTYADAEEELVASACEMLLKNSKAFEKLARENMTLAQKVNDALKKVIARIKADIATAFNGVQAQSLEAQYIALNAERLETMQKLWDRALLAAVNEKNGKNENKAEKLQLRRNGENLLENDLATGYTKKQGKRSYRAATEITEAEYRHHAWAANSITGILDYEDIGAFKQAIAQLKLNKRSAQRTYDGKYIVDVGEYKDGYRQKLIVTDGNYEHPSIDRVYVINFDDKQDVENIREAIIYYERSRVSETVRLWSGSQQKRPFERYGREDALSFHRFNELAREGSVSGEVDGNTEGEQGRSGDERESNRTGENAEVKYELRENAEQTARERLAGALLSIAQNDVEQAKLKAYKAAAEGLNKKAAELAEAKKQLYKTDKVKQHEQYVELSIKVKKLSNQLNIWDSRLVNLEATKPIKDMMERQQAELKQKYTERIDAEKKAGQLRLNEKLKQQKAD